MDISISEVAKRKSIEVFCCYARKDQPLLLELKTHLTPLQREGLITFRADIDIGAGVEWEQEIHRYLNAAQFILLLISPDFMASDYCYSVEMQRALERHERGEAHVIPIILRPVSWRKTPLGKLQALPKDANPITRWSDRDEAFNDVSERLREVVEAILVEEEQHGRAAEAERLAEEERLRKVREEEQASIRTLPAEELQQGQGRPEKQGPPPDQSSYQQGEGQSSQQIVVQTPHSVQDETGRSGEAPARSVPPEVTPVGKTEPPLETPAVTLPHQSAVPIEPATSSNQDLLPTELATSPGRSGEPAVGTVPSSGEPPLLEEPVVRESGSAIVEKQDTSPNQVLLPTEPVAPPRSLIELTVPTNSPPSAPVPPAQTPPSTTVTPLTVEKASPKRVSEPKFSRRIVIMGLVLVLLFGSIGGVIYAANTINRATVTNVINTQANTTATATAQANATATSQASIPGKIWHTQQSGTSQGLSTVTWSGSQFVAVGGNGTIRTSPDGRNWTGQHSGISQYLADVTWSGKQFVAVGEKGTILTSPDGLIWTPQNSSTSQPLFDIVWSGTQFVVVGGQGGYSTVILTSPDGRNWTLQLNRTYPQTGPLALYGVVWSGKQFVAVGIGGTILTSSDGSNWTPQNSGTSQNLVKVAWSGSQFVAVGDFGTYLTSSDGRSWSVRQTDISNSLYGVIWSGSQFVAVGEKGTVLISFDGRSWSVQQSATLQDLYSLQISLTGVAWSGKQFVVVGEKGTILTSP